MFRQHVRKNLTAYCHEELAPVEARRIAEHILVCQRCRSEYEAIKLGVALMRELPAAHAPETIWPQLEAALAQQTEQASSDAIQATTEQSRPVHIADTQATAHTTRRFALFASWPRVAAVSCAALVVACLVGGWYYLRPDAPS